MTPSPCPYCNNSNLLEKIVKGTGWHYIMCMVCNAHGEATPNDNQAWVLWERFASGTRQQKVFKQD